MKAEFKVEIGGNVKYVMESGKDLFAGEMPLADAKKLLSECELNKSKLKGYQIQLGVFHFKGELKK